MKKLLFLLLFCMAGSLALLAHSVNYQHVVLRKWHIKGSEKPIEGSFYFSKKGEVYIEDAQFRVVHFPMNSLSKEDKDYVLNREAELANMNANVVPVMQPTIERGENQNKLWLFGIGIALLTAFAGVQLLKTRRMMGSAVSFSVATLCLLFSFKTKSVQQTQTTTNPFVMDSAFIPFKPDVYTHWDQTYFYVESKGLAKHEMMTGITGWQQQVPIPQCYTGSNAWSIPLNPVIGDTAIPVNQQHFLRGAIAVAVNGIAIFNPYTNTGVDAFLDGQLDQWGGHSGRADDYHYHTAPVHLYSQSNTSRPIAFGLDGFAVYGSVEPDGSPMATLDANHGHFGTNGVYHYHASPSAPYMIGKMVGKVTEDNTMQIIPQAAAHPVRPAGTPLNGAVITSFTPNGTGNGYNMTYTRNGQNYAWNYSWDASNHYTFNYVTPAGTTTTNYTNNQPVCFLPTSVQESISASQELTIFPNPSVNGFSLSLGKELASEDVESIEIFAASGTKVFETKSFSNGMPMRCLSKGVYSVRVHLRSSLVIKKLVIE